VHFKERKAGVAASADVQEALWASTWCVTVNCVNPTNGRDYKTQEEKMIFKFW
jgi:hypothetical protein